MHLIRMLSGRRTADTRAPRGRLTVRGRAKFDAWEVRKGMSSDAAKEAYVKLVDRLLGK